MCVGALVLASLAAVTMLAAGPQSSAPSRTGLIAGRVVDANSDQPIAGATVSVRSIGRVTLTVDVDRAGRATAVSRPVVVTDSQGRFFFSGLTPGGYAVQAQRDGYASIGSAYVDLADAGRETNVPIRMGRRGSIAGTVRDDAGEPVVDVLVMAYLRTSLGGRSPLLVPRGTALTDDRGQYRVGNLMVGDYFVCVCGSDAPLFDPALLSVLPPPSPSLARLTTRTDETLTTFAPTFYPNRRRASEASPVSIDFADDRTGIDIGVTAVGTHLVSGQVVNGAGAPGTLEVLLIAQGDLPEAQALVELRAAVTADGAFEFTGVPTGDYMLLATVRNSTRARDDPWVWASQPVGVGDADVSGVDVTLREGVTVSGRVDYAGQALRPTADALQQTTVSLSPVDLTPAILATAGGTGRVGYPATLGPDGTFRFTGVAPGRYLFMGGTQPPDWQSIGSVRSAGSDLGDTIMTIGPSDLTGVLVTVVDTPLAVVQGSVAFRPYDLPREFFVCLFPTDRTLWPEPFARVARFACEAVSPAGTYQLKAVPPGEYFVALRHSWMVDWTAPRQLEAFARTAPRVRVRAGEYARVDLKR